MERVLQCIKWSLVVLFVLVLSWAALAWSGWLPRPTDVERRAVAELAAPPVRAAGQRDAFAAIWLWQYDIPAGRLDAVAEDEIARRRASAADPATPFTSAVDGRYSKQALPEDYAQFLCAVDGSDCIDKIRAHATATRGLLQAHDLLLGHARALADADHYRNRWPPGVEHAPPEPGSMAMLLLSDAALRFVDGDAREGLARACSATLTWRTLATHADDDIVQAVAGTYYVESARLVAGMRARMPADASMPPECDRAFAPLADPEIAICDTVKSKYAQAADVFRNIGSAQDVSPIAPPKSTWSRVVDRLLFNGRAATDYAAPLYASFCTDDAGIREEAARMDKVAPPFGYGLQGALFDPIGHTVVLIGNPRRSGLPVLAQRMRNMQRMDMLVRAAFARPAAGAGDRSRTAPDAITEDTANHALRIDRAYARSDESPELTIPLPASRLP